jgi:glycine/D-amino acid oxidase-like deaminating enzyme
VLGGYLGRLSPRLAAAMLPIATYVMVTEPLGARLGGALRTGAAVYDTRFAFDYYRPLADTRLLWGGRIAVRERAAGTVARLLHADMLKVYPQLAGVKVDYAWSGMMSYGRHKMPQLGRLPDGMWYGRGFGGPRSARRRWPATCWRRRYGGDGEGLARFARWQLPSTGGRPGCCRPG